MIYFGVGLDQGTGLVDALFRHVALVDGYGLDVVSVSDHP